MLNPSFIAEKLHIAKTIIEWADAYEEEASRHERLSDGGQTNFAFRVEAAKKLQEIRKLVKELHEKERGGSDAHASSRYSQE